MHSPRAHENPAVPARESDRGRLQVVGTGIRAIGQTTLEAVAAIESATKVLYAVADPLTAVWISRLNPAAEPLPAYREGVSRRSTYEIWVDRILECLAARERLCVVFYGHPGVFVYAGHVAIRRARARGYVAEMIAGISATDCLYADLNIDPAQNGCQSFDATDFVRRRPLFDPGTSLILWQVAVTGEDRYLLEDYSSRNVRHLADILCATYGAEHGVILYEAARYGFSSPRMEQLSLSALPAARVTHSSTLFVPPQRHQPTGSVRAPDPPDPLAA